MRAQQVSGRALQMHLGLRCISSLPFPLPPPPPTTTVRSKGYGPTKDLLKGVDTSKRVVVETELHPADAEMQQLVLSLLGADVSVHNSLGGEVDAADSRTVSQQEGIVAISPEQLASVATVIVDQVKEQLELSGYAAEASQDGRSSSVVNAVADCLRQEMQRLCIAMQTQEVSLSRMLGENSDVICARIASVIQAERSSAAARNEGETRQLFHLTQEFTSAVAKLEISLKATLEEGLAANNKNMDPVFEDMRMRVVEAIEQASRVQQEQLAISLQDVLERNNVPSSSAPQDPVSLDAVQDIVRNAITEVVERAQHEVRTLLEGLRENAQAPAPSPDDGSSVKGSDLEGFLVSYGERLEELRELTAGFTDIKELLMEVHSLQQTHETAIQEVQNSIKRLRKELLDALRGTTPSASVEAKAEKKEDLFAEYCDRLADLADRVTSTVEQQLKEQSLDVKELLTQLRALEKRFGEKQKPALDPMPAIHDLDDDRMVALAQSISDSILASLPPSESPQTQAPSFTRESLVEAVAAVLSPKLEELAAAVARMETTRPVKFTVAPVEEGLKGVGEEQFITLAQTIAESVKDAVQEVVPTKELAESMTSKETHLALMTRLEALKEDIVSTVQEEMGRTQEIDLTPFQTYLDQVLGGVQEASSKQQEVTQGKVGDALETLLGQLQQQQQVLLEALQAQQRSSDEAVTPLAITDGLETLNRRLLKEIKDIVSSDASSLRSTLEAVQQEARDTVGRLPEGLEEKLSLMENTIHEVHKSGESHTASLQAALKDVKTYVENIKEEHDAAGPILTSINTAVFDLAQTSIASANEIKAQLSASENKAETLHTQMTSDLSQRFGQLITEVQDGKRRIDELVSSNEEYKGVVTSVEAMRLKLEEVGLSLEMMKTPLFTSPPLEQQPPEQIVRGDAIETRLDNLSEVTQEILSELQKYRSPQETPAPADAIFNKENLEAMEARLNERLQVLSSKLEEMMQLDSAVVPSLEEASPQQSSVPNNVEQYIKDIDALLNHLQSSRSAQVKQMREKLITLRSFLVTGSLVEGGVSNVKVFLEALEKNRLRLREDAAGAEAALVTEVNGAVQQTLERLLSSIEQTLANSTKQQLQQLQIDLNEKSETLGTQQQYMAFQLQDRLNNLTNLQEGHTVALTNEIRNEREEWRGMLNRAIQQEMPAALQGVIAEVCTEQLRSVRNQLDEQETREGKSAEALLSSVREVSKEVSQLGGIGSEMRAVVGQGSATIIEELRHTQDRLAERFERQVSTIMQQRSAEVVSSIGTNTPFATPVVPSPTSLSLWWLCVLSFVVFGTIMACGYFIFAAFLVAFVPVPPPEQLLANAATAQPLSPGNAVETPKKLLSSRVVDQVME
ncbi:protein p166 [Trypanosoma rangeli]|uniref:Protein p166 n=1 Tax=Trypanosoma rangeli TaxID=5698 RepID=A0A422P4B2_TRYRA|nr:protein p166 [Trypanosoma rangeli]RNF12551.1 protein p166 [Trypanosoma rangeli]|eukprot:RNF12551.1 protein p166 [Trypanosoma rangeli]